MDIQIDLSECRSFDMEWSYTGEETWFISGESSCVTFTVPGELCESIAKHLASAWLPVYSDNALTTDQFWLWLGDAAERQRLWDNGYKMKPQRAESRKPCIGDFI